MSSFVTLNQRLNYSVAGVKYLAVRILLSFRTSLKGLGLVVDPQPVAHQRRQINGFTQLCESYHRRGVSSGLRGEIFGGRPGKSRYSTMYGNVP